MITIVFKESRYELYLKSNDEGERQALLQESDGLANLLAKHESHYRCLDAVIEAAEGLGLAHQEVTRSDITTFNGSSLIIPVGGDGTFIDASHYILNRTPILGVNSSPGVSAGFFCYTTASGITAALREMETLPRTILSRMHIAIDGKDTAPAINDVILRHIHLGSSWWNIKDDQEETLFKYPYMLMVSTPGGSTGGMINLGGDIVPIGSSLLQYRFVGLRNEPSRFSEHLDIASRTNRGVMQIDGYHIRYDIHYGTKLEIDLTGPPLTVIGDLEEKQRQHVLSGKYLRT
jgi:NAD+ kinase